MNSEREGRDCGGRGRQQTAVLAVGLVIALALAVQAWNVWRQTGERDIGSFAAGTLCSVLLVNGQIYYGTLQETRPGYIKLVDVYYVQSNVKPDGQRDNKLVNRQKSDWHSPLWQLIPSDKIILLEGVGSDSAVAKLIQTDKAALSPK